jgi:hypothetical protein
MVDTVMLVVADHKNSLADQWMKWIGDLRFERQIICENHTAAKIHVSCSIPAFKT